MVFLVRIMRFVLLLLLGYFIYKIIFKSNGNRKRTGKNRQERIQEMKKDPVCGTYLPEDLAIKLKFNGRLHYFCSVECKDKFTKSK